MLAWKHGIPEAGGRWVAPISSLRQETFDCEEVGQASQALLFVHDSKGYKPQNTGGPHRHKSEA